jgi:calcineurin-like phosphoesterase
MANYIDGRVSLVYGTHTHIQTNDAHILAWGTWIITDIWMNGPFESVIWATFESVEKRFLSWISRGKILQQLQWKYIINALIVEIDDASWKCNHIENISFTWNLS